MRMVVSIAPHPGHGAGDPGATCGCGARARGGALVVHRCKTYSSVQAVKTQKALRNARCASTNLILVVRAGGVLRMNSIPGFLFTAKSKNSEAIPANVITVAFSRRRGGFDGLRR